MRRFSFGKMVRSYVKVDQTWVARNSRAMSHATLGVRGDTVAAELCAEIMGRISKTGNCAGQVKQLDRLRCMLDGWRQYLVHPHWRKVDTHERKLATQAKSRKKVKLKKEIHKKRGHLENWVGPLLYLGKSSIPGSSMVEYRHPPCFIDAISIDNALAGRRE